MLCVCVCIILQLEMDLQKVKVERLRSSKAVGDYMETFERKRTQDLKVFVYSCIITVYSEMLVLNHTLALQYKSTVVIIFIG